MNWQEPFFQIGRSDHVLRTLSSIFHWKSTNSFCIIDQSFASKTHSDNLYSWKLGTILSSKFVGFVCDFRCVVTYIMLYKVVLSFDYVDEILKCDHSNESYWAVLSFGAVYYAVEGVSELWVCVWNPKVWSFKCKKQNFPVVLFDFRYITKWNSDILIFFSWGRGWGCASELLSSVSKCLKKQMCWF